MFLIISSQHSGQKVPCNLCSVLPFSAQTFPRLLISFRGKKGTAYSNPEPYVICPLTTPLPHLLLVSPVSLGFTDSDLLTVLLIYQLSSYIECFFFHLCCSLYLKYSSPKYPHDFLSHLLQISVQILSSKRRLP